MVEIYIGEQVRNRRGERGVITAFDSQYITVDYPDRTASVVIDGFEKGYIKYENAKLQDEVQESIAKAEIVEKQKEEEARAAAKKAKEAALLAPQAINNTIKFETVVTRLDPAPVSLNSVRRKDHQKVLEIFDDCNKDIQTLYEKFEPKMVYPKYTSNSRSKYHVGFLNKYADSYVFRIFSRNDLYKKRVRTGITVMRSTTTEVLRVMLVGETLYYFTKNMAVSSGYYNNTTANFKWCGSKMGAEVFLNEVICDCDCGYLNGCISDSNANVQAIWFIKLLFEALRNNKAEIVFKNKAFVSTYGIDNLAEYLDEFSPKQIDFASKNDVIHTLPFIKKFGISDVELLRDLDAVMEKRSFGDSIYMRLKGLLNRMGQECPDFDKRLMNFVKNADDFNAALYFDYLQELGYLPAAGMTMQDLFDRNYAERHDALNRERLMRLNRRRVEEDANSRKEYEKTAENLSWIDREEKGYFIIVPKTIEEFREEGFVQHNCVYSLRYYDRVINQDSIIVFLRQKKDIPYITIEYDYYTFKVRQALGKFNRKIDPELYQYVVDLGKQLYYEMHTLQ